MSGIDNGWLEAAIAWEVCASLHRQYCKGKDDLFTTRQSDFMKHAENARRLASRRQAPAAVAGPSEAVAYLDIGTGGYLDLGTDLTDEALSRLPKGRHALVIAGTYGIDGYTAAPTTQPSPAAQEDALDAARYRWLREGNDAKHGAAWHVAVNLYGCEWDAAIDDARKEMS